MTLKKQKALLITFDQLGDAVSTLYTAIKLEEIFDIEYLTYSQWSSVFTPLYKTLISIDQVTDRSRYDAIIDFTSNSRSRKTVRYFKAKTKIGRMDKAGFKRIRNRLFTYTNIVSKNRTTKNIVRRYADILNFFGISSEGLGEYALFNYIKPIATKVAIHIGASNPIRIMPVDFWAEICLSFKKMAIPVQLIGTEENIAQEILSKSENYAEYHPCSIKDVMKDLSKSTLFIGSDSGILHLAAMLGVPSIGIYGPNTFLDAGPTVSNFIPISVSPKCAPCDQDSGDCLAPNRCLDLLSSKYVMKFILDMNLLTIPLTVC